MPVFLSAFVPKGHCNSFVGAGLGAGAGAGGGAGEAPDMFPEVYIASALFLVFSFLTFCLSWFLHLHSGLHISGKLNL